jgi:hypothetical protein
MFLLQLGVEREKDMALTINQKDRKKGEGK